MTAQDIRTRWGSAGNYTEQEHMAGVQVDLTAELAAQVAELNESRKPRWVNLSSTLEPCLVDATQVIGLSSGYVEDGSNGARPCVYVRLRAQEKPFAVFDMDHDEVRGKLGISEDWMQSTAPYRAPDSVNVSAAEWNAATTAMDDARLLLETVPTDAPHAEDLRKSIATFDDLSMPF